MTTQNSGGGGAGGAGCLAAVMRLFGINLQGGDGGGSKSSDARGDEPPSVIVNKRFLSAAERSFFHTLRRAVSEDGGRGDRGKGDRGDRGDRYYVLAQVSLQQLLFFTQTQRRRGAAGAAGANARARGHLQRWRNKVAARAIDFVICEVETMRPVVAFELDDRSHATPRRQSRDEEVEQVLGKAGLPLLHHLAGPDYDVNELREALAEYLE